MSPSLLPQTQPPQFETPVPATPQSNPISQHEYHSGAMEVVGSILTVFLLLFFFPLGLIVMWFFTKWPKIVKIILTIFFLLIGTWLAIVGFTVYNSLQSTKRDSVRRNDIQAISSVLEKHFDLNAGGYLVPQSDWFPNGKIPQDPNGSSYRGIPTGPVTQFKICATLENATVSSGPTEYCVENQR